MAMRWRRVVFPLAFAALAVGAFIAPTVTQAFGPIASIGPQGAATGEISRPTAVDVGPEGNVYVADSNNHRVDVFAADGTFIRAIGRNVKPGGGNVCTPASGCVVGDRSVVPGAISTPLGVAVHPAGLIYVSSGDNNRVDVFSADGTFVRGFGKDVNPSGGDTCTSSTGCRGGAENGSAASLRVPAGIDFGPDGTVYVADYGQNRINVYTTEGVFLRSFGKGVNPSGGDLCTAASGCQEGTSTDYRAAAAIPLPYDVAVNGSSQVAVTDFVNARISVFTLQGTFVHAFGKDVNPAGGDLCTAVTGCQKGTESGAAGGLSGPAAAAVDGSGHLYVADTLGNRVAEFTFEGTFVRAFGEGVMNGASVFQVCTTATGCTTGLANNGPTSIFRPYAVAVDCRGAVYASNFWEAPGFPKVRRYGEPGTASPPCPPAPPSSSPEAAPSSDQATPDSSIAKRPKLAKPIIRIELNPGTGTASLIVVVSDPGTLLLRGKDIRKAKRAAKRPGEVELLVVPTAKVKKKLEQARKATVKVALTFKADEGGSITLSKSIRLKLAAALGL